MKSYEDHCAEVQDRTDRDQMHRETKDILSTAKNNGRDLTADEANRLDALTGRIDQLDSGGTPGVRRTSPIDPSTGKTVASRQPKPNWVQAMTDRNAVEQMSDGGFAGLGDFLSSVADTKRGKFDERLDSLDIRAQQGIGTGSDGGYLVPERFSANLLMSAAENYPFLAMRDIETLTGPGSGLVRPKVDDRDQSGEDIGGVAMQRVSENSTLSGQTVTFGSEELRLSKAAALVRVSNELMSDSGVGVERSLRQVFSRQLGQRQALDFVSGTGSGEPLGFLNSGNLITPARSSSNAVDLSDVAQMASDLVPAAFNRAVWLAHPSTAEQIIQISDSASRNVFLGQDAGQSAPTTLLGRPLFYTSALPTLGNKGDICLVDPTAYFYVHRTISIDVSSQVDFDSDQTAFRAVLRDDGHPHYDSTLTDEQSDTLSEFVALGA